jgi:hypothetical protein
MQGQATWSKPMPHMLLEILVEEALKGNKPSSTFSVEKLSKKIGDVAFAIQSFSKNQLDVNELYTEVMKIEGFDEITLGDAFDHLVQHEMLAKTFMAKKC